MANCTAYLILAIALVFPWQSNPSENTARVVRDFVDDLVNALGHVALARDALQSVKPTGELLPDTFSAMTARRKAISRVQDARGLMVPHKESRSTNVREAANACDQLFLILQELWATGNRLDEELLKVKDQEGLAALVPKLSKRSADLDEAWRKLPLVAALAAHTLVNEDRLASGKLAYLHLTRTERETMVSRIDRLFPKASQPGGGHAVDVAAGILRQTLTKAWKSSDERE